MSQEFEKNLQETLASGAQRVDQATRDELARRRGEVLAASAPRSPLSLLLWVPAAGLTAVLFASLLVQPFWPVQMPDTTAADRDDVDMEILLAEEGLELYEELEFYEWLDVASDAADDAG